ncbi:MAG TPA: 2-oxoglutarate dehydrogenase E1 component [Longimicrobiales bacterium]|nr:2-oxoglutarate dehydrogenase E1 component [Longimicrobiales bacterium]
MERSLLFDSYNAGYAQAIYEQYIQNPASVDAEWRRLFESGAVDAGLLTDGVARLVEAPASEAQLAAAVAIGKLVMAYRLNGHWAARLDPLGSEPEGHPTLDPEFHGVSPADLEAVPATVLHLGAHGQTMADVLEWLREVYSGTIGYEYEHVEDPDRRNWLRDTIEAGEFRRPLEPDKRRRLLERLTEVEALEQFLHRAYLGAKRFSIEGNDMLVPMLDYAIELAAANGAREVVMGMAHRGRLNVLTHVLGRPYTAILGEFEGQHAPFGTTGDVKYHMGAEGTYATASGQPLTVTLVPNPSHLEFVNPVVEGLVRAKQTNRHDPALPRDERRVLPILIHGDAAFSGQGVVAETLNMARLAGYRTGGTLHIIVNNQIGFTTLPRDSRSMRYSSDMALGFDIPIFHVNADDPEACLAVIRLAMAYQERFQSDVLIDLIGYRRHGHNEGDEPSYTQPIMYRAIHQHPTVRKIWADRLVAEGVVTEAEVEAMWEAAYQRLVDAQAEVRRIREANGETAMETAPPEVGSDEDVVTAVSADNLRAYDRELHTWPADFNVNPKLKRQLERRAKVLETDGPIDWAHAEALAFASLLAEGTPIRMTGQDAERGTFSQRHTVLHDVETGRSYCPLRNLSMAKAGIEIYNSPLTELGVLGFEYGYSVAAPEALVIWEAQFGDFANGAQVIIDQFISAGRAKWGQASRLTLLLPHGYEGQGPEHSSARVERFLQLAAEDNLRVANCTTPAQYFHLLRLQAYTRYLRPLVVFTPKSLLRHPRAVSRLADLAEGRFQPVLPDERGETVNGEVSRILVCSGKVYYDLLGNENAETAKNVAIVRVEQLYPFPREELAAAIARYTGARELVWVQEEPENSGAWRFVAPHLRAIANGEAGLIEPGRLQVRYIGRPERASPAEGHLTNHEKEQARIVADAFDLSGLKAKLAGSGGRRGRK